MQCLEAWQPGVRFRMTSSSDIKVDKLRTVFFWPLVLECRDDDFGNIARNARYSLPNLLNEQFDVLVRKTPWKPVTDTLKHLGDQQNVKDAYGEYVYFHDFLQKTLFESRSKPSDNHPLMLLQRTDIQELDVTFEHGWKNDKPLQKSLSLAIERLNLYLLRPGIAVMALQVVTKEPQDLATSLRFNDIMRRSHLPFYGPSGEPSSARPLTVAFKLSDSKTQSFDTNIDIGHTPASSDSGEGEKASAPQKTLAETLADMRPKQRRLLPYSHWRWLITGGSDDVFPFELKRFGKASWRHFSDERLPILTTYVLESRDDYYSLDDGNWSRLTFVDPPGFDPMPYATDFLNAQFANHAYDRYHHKPLAKADAPVRYLMCDYAMTTVTYRRETRPERCHRGNTTNDFAAVIEMHMQRHYYQMFLLSVIDKSVMLGISSRISTAVEIFDRTRSTRVTEAVAEERLMNAMEEINKDFLHYVHRFRFTGISGQLQPSEMYAKLRAVMGLDVLFSDIRTELDTAVAFLSGRSEKRGAEATERLGVVATLALVIGLVMGFFSMNIVTDADVLFATEDNTLRWMEGWRLLLTGIGGFSLLVGLMVTIMAYIKTENFIEGRLYPKITQGVLIFLGALCLCLAQFIR